MCNKHQVITKNIIKEFLPKRPSLSHKYDFGHTLIIGGCLNYTGAPILAAEAALKVGSGLVSLAIPDRIYNIVASKISPEIIVKPFSSTQDGFISSKALEEVLDYLIKRRVNTICLGCGIGKQEETKLFVNNFLKFVLSPHTSFPKEIDILVDADGFSLLEMDRRLIKSLKNKTQNVILTPHTGEYKNLLKISDSEWEKLTKNFDFCKEAQDFAKINNVVLVLKSAYTTISDGEYIFKTNTPNSALAKGGSGDVLAGLIAGLVYQVKNYNKTLVNYNYLLKSAILAVYLHQQAAIIGRTQKTDFCFTPTDIIDYLPDVFKELI